MENTMFDSLLQLPLFQGMSMTDFHSILTKTRMEFQKVMPGETILTAGQRCSEFVFVLNGTAEGVRTGESGLFTFSEEVSAPYLIEPQSMFGMSAQYTHTYRAVSQCSIVRIEKQYIYTELGKFNIFRMNLLNMISNKAQNAENYIWKIRSTSIREKIILFITCLSDVQNGQKRLAVRMEDLAALIDATRINVSRELNSLEAMGVIMLKRKEIVVPDMSRLCELLDRKE